MASYGYYENHGHVRTKGYNLSLLYSFSHWFDIGGTFNSIDTRDYEKFLAGSSLQESMHYKVRMPNLPYRYANINANFYWNDLFVKGNAIWRSASCRTCLRFGSSRYAYGKTGQHS